MKDSTLDMRMDKSETLTAKEIINTYKEEELADIIDKYGEEKFAKKIAKNICIARQKKEIQTTGELVEIIKKTIPMKFQTRWTSSKKNVPSNKDRSK